MQRKPVNYTSRQASPEKPANLCGPAAVKSQMLLHSTSEETISRSVDTFREVSDASSLISLPFAIPQKPTPSQHNPKQPTITTKSIDTTLRADTSINDLTIKPIQPPKPPQLTNPITTLRTSSSQDTLESIQRLKLMNIKRFEEIHSIAQRIIDKLNRKMRERKEKEQMNEMVTLATVDLVDEAVNAKTRDSKISDEVLVDAVSSDTVDVSVQDDNQMHLNEASQDTEAMNAHIIMIDTTLKASTFNQITQPTQDIDQPKEQTQEQPREPTITRILPTKQASRKRSAESIIHISDHEPPLPATMSSSTLFELPEISLDMTDLFAYF